ncbi:CRISPR-associated protein Cas5 [Streptomyces sp900116325]|uniref:CRISPR-associated protein Cas5 n=1 Tax=Streptomyces sp. 900116325 TaxID=3154295 RepID=UPI0033BA4B1B
MNGLLLRLSAPLMSFGEHAAFRYRDTAPFGGHALQVVHEIAQNVHGQGRLVQDPGAAAERHENLVLELLRSRASQSRQMPPEGVAPCAGPGLPRWPDHVRRDLVQQPQGLTAVALVTGVVDDDRRAGDRTQRYGRIDGSLGRKPIHQGLHVVVSATAEAGNRLETLTTCWAEAGSNSNGLVLLRQVELVWGYSAQLAVRVNLGGNGDGLPGGKLVVMSQIRRMTRN